MATLEQAFGIRNMLADVGLFGETPETPILDMYRAGTTKEVEGTSVEWDREDFDRALAPFGSVEAPAIRQFGQNRDLFVTPMADVSIDRFLSAQKIFVDQRGNGELRPNAEAMINRAVVTLRNKGLRVAEYMAAELIFNKTGLTVDSTTVPGSDVTFTIDPGTTDVNASASWATAGTDILGDIRSAADTHVQNCGMEAARALHNRDVLGYLTNNTDIQGWFQRTTEGIDFIRNSGPSRNALQAQGGLASVPGWFQHDHGYVPEGGSFTKFIANDFLALLPETNSFLGFAQGGIAIPPTAIGRSEVGAAAGEVDVVFGPVTYAIWQEEPLGVRIIHKWRFICVILLPECVTLLDTTP